MSGASVLPPELLQAVVDRDDSVALVIGAGCSLEAPTSLRLSSVYSEAAFEQLKRSGVLADGDCDPSDLSEVASAVFAKTGEQKLLVNALPRERYQLARPNLGHRLAIALMAEGAIACIVTVNYDMALSAAMTELQVEIKTVSAPRDMGRFGGKAVVYLHRNAYEPNVEDWVLRKEVIEDHWKTGWESVVAERVASLPHLVFAGLGSKAAAITESLKRVKERIGDTTRTYLVDPSARSAFADEVTLALPEHHIQQRWVQFMTQLADRLVNELVAEVSSECDNLAAAYGWADGDTKVDPVLTALASLNLVEFGVARAQWLGTGTGGHAPDSVDHRSYVASDQATTKYMADLLLGLGALAKSDDCTVEVTAAGTFRVNSPSNAAGPLTVQPVAGRGLAPWGVIDQVEQVCAGAGPRSADVILYSGLHTNPPAAPVAPTDILGDVPPDDITYAVTSLRKVSVNDLRTNAALRAELAR